MELAEIKNELLDNLKETDERNIDMCDFLCTLLDCVDYRIGISPDWHSESRVFTCAKCDMPIPKVKGKTVPMKFCCRCGQSIRWDFVNEDMEG